MQSITAVSFPNVFFCSFFISSHATTGLKFKIVCESCILFNLDAGCYIEWYMGVREYPIVIFSLHQTIDLSKGMAPIVNWCFIRVIYIWAFFYGTPKCLVCVAASIQKREETRFLALTRMIPTCTPIFFLLFLALPCQFELFANSVSTLWEYTSRHLMRRCVAKLNKKEFVSPRYMICPSLLVPTNFSIGTLQQLLPLPAIYCFTAHLSFSFLLINFTWYSQTSI